MRSYKLVSVSLWLALATSLALLVVFFVVSQGAAGQTQAEETTLDGQVIGGRAVPNEKYPFVAALLSESRGGSAYQQQFCGGTLVDQNSILTAAHCVEGVRANSLRVTVGRTVLNRRQGMLRNVARIFVHPKYSGRSHRNDVAILKLKSPGDKVKPIRIPNTRQNRFEKSGSRATVSGWGNTIAQPISGSNRANYPYRMQEAQVPVRTDKFARSVYGVSYAPRLMVAAGKTGKDTCQGDSGGPMFKKASGAYYQIGVTSFGAGCGAPGYPGVYTEVNSPTIRNFIVRASLK